MKTDKKQAAPFRVKPEDIKTLSARLTLYADLQRATLQVDKVRSVGFEFKPTPERDYPQYHYLYDEKVMLLFFELLREALAKAEPVIMAMHEQPPILELITGRAPEGGEPKEIE